MHVKHLTNTQMFSIFSFSVVFSHPQPKCIRWWQTKNENLLFSLSKSDFKSKRSRLDSSPMRFDNVEHYIPLLPSSPLECRCFHPANKFVIRKAAFLMQLYPISISLFLINSLRYGGYISLKISFTLLCSHYIWRFVIIQNSKFHWPIKSLTGYF